ncbi:metallophosphoesterase [Brevibacillus dissolubilis]|uniref:metallophosphoesterase n=1 Tax=Brevibacillus dissolubilis TaxID=1844116 RepID=UPI00159BA7EC|nr:metallophosphoesterase [Brevibacillus dissolubilis]
MLVVISDLHFSDETAGTFNLSYESFGSVFVNDILSLARTKQAHEIRLLILGDLVDLLITRQWLDEPLENRPWGARGLQDSKGYRPEVHGESPVEARSLQILNAIYEANRETFDFFKHEFRQVVKDELGIPVHIYYVPGNHDRMVNTYPKVRDRLQELFGFNIEDHKQVDAYGEWWYQYEYTAENYGVFARHGHQFDLVNFNGGTDFSLQGERKTALGDVLTTEFFVKIIDLFIREKEQNELFRDELVEYIKYITDIRPIQRTAHWLNERIQNEPDPQLQELLQQIKNEAVDNLITVPFVREWVEEYVKKNNQLMYWLHKVAYPICGYGLMKRIVRFIVHNMTLGKIIEMINKSDGQEGTVHDTYVRSAYGEPAWKNNPRIQYVLYGHTHSPLQSALEKRDNREVLYINTGTWRPRLYMTVDSKFVRVNQVTFAVFYDKHEDVWNEEAGDVNFEWWNGNHKRVMPKLPSKVASKLPS